MSTLACFLEEESAKYLLEGVLPKLLPSNVTPRYRVFEGKQDLEKSLAGKLRTWSVPDTRFLVLRDQDRADCRSVKAALVDRVEASGRPALVRVACRELEAWMLGDLEAVASAYGRPGILAAQAKAHLREPDLLDDPVATLKDLTASYQKLDGARRIGPLLDPSRNRSRSFRAFCDGVRRMYSLGSG